MKLYCLTVDGDIEYVSGYTPIQALKFYCEETGLGLSELEDGDTITEVPKLLWGTISVKDTEGGGENLTMEDLMSDVVRPELIATSYE